MLQVVGLVVRWFPVIVGIVMSLEAVVNPNTSGAEKRKAAIAAIVSFFRGLGITLSPAQLESLGKVIDGVIAVLNLLGVFRHKADLPPAEVAALEEAAVADPVAVSDAVVRVAADDEAFDRFLRNTAR